MDKRDRTPNGMTTIQLSMDTRNALKALGHKGETYEELLQQMIAMFKKHGNHGVVIE